MEERRGEGGHETRGNRFGGHAGEPDLWGTIIWTHLSVKARGEGSMARAHASVKRGGRVAYAAGI
jgi:hypothetical protein